ncbi:hypothetical protein Droror1_Dr00004052 [Drosera rotundifolia]
MGQIQYSDKYFDDTYEYRHVVLPPEVAKLLPKNRLLSEASALHSHASGATEACSLNALCICYELFVINVIYAEMSGVLWGFSKAAAGFTMQSIALSHTSCCSGGLSITSNNRRIKFTEEIMSK